MRRFRMYLPTNSATYNRVLAQLYYIIVGQPRCSDEKLKAQVMVFDLPTQETNLYRQFESHIQASQLMYFLWSAIFILKNFYFSFYIIIAANTITSDSSEYISSTNTTAMTSGRTNYACLTTNCSRLTENNPLIRDLRELPVFTICHPNTHSIYAPLTVARSLGLSIYTVFSYYISLVGIVEPIEFYWHPVIQDSRMFSLTPTFSIASHRERARKYLREVFRSMQYFYCDLYNRSEIMFDLSNRRKKDREDFARTAKKSSYLAPENALLRLLEPNHDQLCQQVKDYLSDCLPLARSYAWSQRAGEIFCILFTLLFMETIISHFIAVVYLMRFGDNIYEELLQIDSFTRSNDCGFWVRRGPSEQGIKPVTLAETVQYNNWLYIFEYITVLVPGCYILAVNVVTSMISLLEVDFMLNEQLVHTDLALKFAELAQNDNLDSLGTKGIDILTGEGCFKMQPARDSSLEKSWHFYSPYKPLEDHIALNIITDNQNHQQELYLDSFVDLITKIYVSNRIIKDIGYNSSPPVSVILTHSYAASYISVIILLFINRCFETKSLAPIILAVVGLFVTNTIVTLASRVQSTTNRLVLSMWKLIAATDNIKDLRVRHIRRLVIKQVVVIGHDGFLDIKAFGLSVTYASLFEAVIWSSTLALYSFTD